MGHSMVVVDRKNVGDQLDQVIIKRSQYPVIGILGALAFLVLYLIGMLSMNTVARRNVVTLSFLRSSIFLGAFNCLVVFWQYNDFETFIAFFGK